MAGTTENRKEVLTTVRRQNISQDDAAAKHNKDSKEGNERVFFNKLLIIWILLAYMHGYSYLIFSVFI